jgi:hypothetical protein
MNSRLRPVQPPRSRGSSSPRACLRGRTICDIFCGSVIVTKGFDPFDPTTLILVTWPTGGKSFGGTPWINVLHDASRHTTGKVNTPPILMRYIVCLGWPGSLQICSEGTLLNTCSNGNRHGCQSPIGR